MPGQTRTYELRIKNHRRHAIEVQVGLSLPSGWRCDPNLVKVGVPPQQSAKASVSVSIPRDWHSEYPRIAITADVFADGKYLGQIAEAVVEVRARDRPAEARNAAGF